MKASNWFLDLSVSLKVKLFLSFWSKKIISLPPQYIMVQNSKSLNSASQTNSITQIRGQLPSLVAPNRFGAGKWDELLFRFDEMAWDLSWLEYPIGGLALLQEYTVPRKLSESISFTNSKIDYKWEPDMLFIQSTLC